MIPSSFQKALSKERYHLFVRSLPFSLLSNPNSAYCAPFYAQGCLCRRVISLDMMPISCERRCVQAHGAPGNIVLGDFFTL